MKKDIVLEVLGNKIASDNELLDILDKELQDKGTEMTTFELDRHVIKVKVVTARLHANREAYNLVRTLS